VVTIATVAVAAVAVKPLVFGHRRGVQLWQLKEGNETEAFQQLD